MPQLEGHTDEYGVGYLTPKRLVGSWAGDGIVWDDGTTETHPHVEVQTGRLAHLRRTLKRLLPFKETV